MSDVHQACVLTRPLSCRTCVLANAVARDRRDKGSWQMQIQSFNQTERATSVAHIAHPESVVMLAATVRAAREMLRRDRIDGLKVRVSRSEERRVGKECRSR